ncbi:MAG TPA: acyltransferase [Bryobacteraceae bacterium]|nr:acyltransferase [Bryobacteraceae bacterium]
MAGTGWIAEPGASPARTATRYVPTGHRIPALDGLRGFAILIVVLYHCRTLGHPPRAIASLFEIGWTGVDLFFVLSGFLITGILLDSRSAPNYFSSFYARRVLRIFPLYYFAVSLVLIAGSLRLLPSRGRAASPAWCFLFAQNWIFVDVPFLGHFWSLAVEEQFYLLWPLVVYLFPKRRILPIAVAGSAAAVPLRLALMLAGVNPNYIYWNTFARMDALLIGAACACLLKEGRWREQLARHAKWLWCIPLFTLPGLKFLLKGFRIAPATQRFGYTIVALSYACLLLALALGRSPLQSFFGSGPMRALGRYSYAAYVWHPLILAAVLTLERYLWGSQLPWFLNLPFVWSVVLAASAATYFVIERPFLSLKRHFQPR